MRRTICAAICSAVLLLAGFGTASAQSTIWKSMRVSATAYNSVPSQTSGNPFLAAWGDILKPGMHAIAVSRDLIEKGLTYGTKVKIAGLPGVYIVLDKMAARWSNKIDIYMGTNIAKARDWGIKHNLKILYANTES